MQSKVDELSLKRQFIKIQFYNIPWQSVNIKGLNQQLYSPLYSEDLANCLKEQICQIYPDAANAIKLIESKKQFFLLIELEQIPLHQSIHRFKPLIDALNSHCL